MSNHINKSFRLFIRERINGNVKDIPNNTKDFKEIEPDDDEYIDDDISMEFDRIMGDDNEEDDDLIEELHREYKRLQRQYENRLHQRKSGKTI